VMSRSIARPYESAAPPMPSEQPGKNLTHLADRTEVRAQSGYPVRP
jgi:hypothetical protein